MRCGGLSAFSLTCSAVRGKRGQLQCAVGHAGVRGLHRQRAAGDVEMLMRLCSRLPNDGFIRSAHCCWHAKSLQQVSARYAVTGWVLEPHLSGAGGEAPTAAAAAAAATKDPAQAAPPRAPTALRFAVRGRRRSWRSARAMWMLGHPAPCPNLALHCAMLRIPPFAVCFA